MSLESWKKEFMPEPARSDCSLEDAIYHAIRKWTGFRRENTHKHDVAPSELPDRGSDCCFCLMFHSVYNSCIACPLNEAVYGGCLGSSLKSMSPYEEWLTKHNPEPMIDLLYAGLFWLYSEGKIE